MVHLYIVKAICKSRRRDSIQRRRTALLYSLCFESERHSRRERFQSLADKASSAANLLTYLARRTLMISDAYAASPQYSVTKTEIYDLLPLPISFPAIHPHRHFTDKCYIRNVTILMQEAHTISRSFLHLQCNNSKETSRNKALRTIEKIFGILGIGINVK